MIFSARWTATMAGALSAMVISGCGDGSTAPGRIEGPEPLSFFATSIGTVANGGNYGGLSGADDLCQSLAQAAGGGTRVWHAYLSTAEEDARDRIGLGPWYNANGVMVAADVRSLHADGIPFTTPAIIVDETGAPVTVLEHDIVTGTRTDGTWFEGRTCEEWTSNSADAVAQVGHSDAITVPELVSVWNSTHESASCTQEGLAERFGAGRIYCFAIR